jgi:hypothetical protein
MHRGGPSRAGGHAAAFASSVEVLREWHRRSSGPKVPLTQTYEGTYTVSSAALAAALQGVLVIGKIVVTVGNVTLRNFGVQAPTGLSTAAVYELLASSGGVSDVRVADFYLDGSLELAAQGIGGTLYSERWRIERGDISRCGNDAMKLFKNSTYRHMYVHDHRPWDVATDGEYDGVPNNARYPHRDPLQATRGGQTIEESYFDNGTDDAATSGGGVIKCDSEQIASFTMRRTFIKGGTNYCVHTAAGSFGQPLNVLYEDIRVSKEYGGYGTHGPFSDGTVDPGNITYTRCVWADDGTPVS